MLTAHGKTKAYLHRFNVIQSPECICPEGDRTVDRLIYDCGKLEKKRGKLIAQISREDNWTVQKKKCFSEQISEAI
jgi:precorrin-6B methylase 2